MRYLTQGGESQQRFELLLQLTRIASDDVKYALKDHLVTGLAESTAASLNGVKLSNFKRALDSLNESAAIVEQIKQLDWARFRSVK